MTAIDYLAAATAACIVTNLLHWRFRRGERAFARSPWTTALMLVVVTVVVLEGLDVVPRAASTFAVLTFGCAVSLWSIIVRQAARTRAASPPQR